MAQQIKKKFLKNDSVDGQKLKLLKDQAVRGQKQDGSEVELLKLDGSDKLVHDGKEVAFKSQVDDEASTRSSEDSRIEGLISTEKSERESAISKEQSDRDAAILVEKQRAEGQEGMIRSEFAAADLVLKGQVEQEISDAIAQEQSDRSAAVFAEKQRAEMQEGMIRSEFAAADLVLKGQLEQEIQDSLVESKSYTDSKVSTEKSERIQGDLDTLNSAKSYTDGKIDLVMSNLDTEALDSLVEVVSAFQAADSDINLSISSLAQAATNALNKEKQDRQDADSLLKSQVEQELTDAIAKEVIDRNSAILVEKTRAEGQEGMIRSEFAAADLVLKGQLEQELNSAISTEVSNRNSAISSAISTEVAARDAAILVEKQRAQLAESGISTDLDNLDGYAQDIRSDLDQEILDRAAAVSAEASARQSADSSLQTSLNSEISARQSADSSLRSDLNSEISARQAGDSALQTSLNSEISARQSADTSLRTDLNSEISRAQTAESSEQTARIAADTALSLRVTAEETLSNYLKGSIYNDSPAVYADGMKASEDPSAVTRQGFYYQNTVAGQFATAYYYDGVANPVLRSQMKSTFAVMTFDDKTAKPIFVMYSAPTGSGDVMPGFAHSKWVYQPSAASMSSVVVGKKYLVWAGDSEPVVHPELPRLKADYIAASSGGARATTESMSTISFISDPTVTVNKMKWLVESLGVFADNFKAEGMCVIRSATKANLDAEISARTSADTALSTSISNEVTARTNAVSAEASARQSADTALQSSITQEIADRKTAVSAEQTRAMGVESGLQSSLNSEISSRQAGDSALQTSLNSEISARQSADTSLQSSINTEKGRIDAILAASQADKDSFAEIVQLINSVDTANDQAFASYVLSNNAALATEVADRKSADSQLSSSLSSEISRAQGEESRIEGKFDGMMSTEKSARELGDQNLHNEIVAEIARAEGEESRIESKFDGKFVTEIAARQSEDLYLQEQITAEGAARAASVQEIADILDQEVIDRQNANDVLQQEIDALSMGSSQGLQDEIARATAAEQSLEENKVAKAGDTMSGSLTFDQGEPKTSVMDYHGITITNSDTGEVLFMGNDDQGYSQISLTSDNGNNIYVGQGIIDMEDGDGNPLLPQNDSNVVVKLYVDQQDNAIIETVTSNKSEFDTFVSQTGSDISAIQGRLTALEVQTDGPYFNKMKFVIDEASELSSVQLEHECMENSLVVCVGRLMVHKDEDYSVSVVDGKTVLTWMGDFASGGVEAIEEGDVVFVTYAREV